MTMQKPDITKLVSWWGFEEPSGVAYDAHGTNNLTQLGGTIERTAGVMGYGRNFEADQTEGLFLLHLDSSGLSFGDDPFTIGAWVKPESIALMHLIDKTSGYSTQYAYKLSINSTGFPRFRISSDGVNYTTLLYGSAISAGSKYLILAWHDPDTNKIYLQVNNGAVAEEAHSGGCYSGYANFVVGDAWDEKGVHNGYYDGMMDEPFVYAGILTADQRAWFYNGGAGRSYYELNPLGGFMAMF